MLPDKVPQEIMQLLRVYDPDLVPIRTAWHSDRCCTMSAVRPDHHAVRVRWNQADDGHWTLIPLSLGRLNIVRAGK